MNDDDTHRLLVIEYLKYFKNSEQFEANISVSTLRNAMRALHNIELLIRQRKREMREKYRPKKKFRMEGLINDKISSTGKKYSELTESISVPKVYDRVVLKKDPIKKPRKYIPPVPKLPPANDDTNQN